MCRNFLKFLTAVNFLFLPLSLFAVPKIETFVLVAGGQSNPSFPNPPPFACTTYSGAPEVTSFFGANGVSIPTDGLAQCSIAGSFNAKSSVAGLLTDSSSINTTFNSGQNSFVGNVQTSAAFGALGTEAHGTFTGFSNSGIVNGTEAVAKFTESYTITSPSVPNGTSGSFRFSYFVDGSLTVNGPDPYTSTGDVEVMYQSGSGPIYTLMRAQVTRASQPPFLAVPTGIGSVSNPGVYGGYTLALGSVTGGDTVKTFEFPFTFGTPFEFTIGILTYAIPSTGATIDADFFSTVTMNGIEIFNNSSQPVLIFSVAAASGTKYDKNGLRIDIDGDGFTVGEGDCDDSNEFVNPSASETCDGLDNDCDGTADDNPPGEGIVCSTGIPGICSIGTTACTSGVIQCKQTQVPATETCDGIDNNCNGSVDEGFDFDSDGAPDCSDLCPADSFKIAPGICGCGASDLDEDGDATPNCNDACPKNGLKTSPGICGCVVGDFDSDGDKTPDCIDECTEDPTTIVEGACGCGIPEVDADGNGILDCILPNEIKSKIRQLRSLLRNYHVDDRGHVTNLNKSRRRRMTGLLNSLSELVNANVSSFVNKPGEPTVLELTDDAVTQTRRVLRRGGPTFRERKRQALRALQQVADSV